jgi:hypothetical protein
MNEEKQLTEIESLSIIQRMIDTAKTEQKDNGMGWIVWGWFLFTASVLTLMNIKLNWKLDTFFFWNAFGIVTVVYFIYETIRYFFFKKTERVRTYTGDLFKKLNIGFFISLMFVIFAINLGSRYIYKEFGEGSIVFVNIGFSLLVSLYAFWILIYGTALNFKPSIIGAYASWAFGFTAMFINEFQWVMALHAGAVLVGYIIPGHIANNEFKKIQRRSKVQ